jgi:hypothetical protein
MKKKKKGYGILMAITILLTLAAVATLIPNAAASGESMLGYNVFCTFAPISTLLCIVAAGIVCMIRKRKLTE